MKITPQTILPNDSYEKTPKSQKSSNKKFDAILNKTIENNASAKVGLQNSTPKAEILNTNLTLLDPVEKIALLARTEKLLDLLEDYYKKLGSPVITLKDLSPLITALETAREGLLPLLNALPAGDDLKHILNQTLISSSIEVIKFNRGDYLPA